MPDVQFSQEVRRADRLSKSIALFCAIAIFGLGMILTGDLNLSSVAAAGVGIGVRFVVPYRASLSIPEDERTEIKNHPAAGNYNHGAVGGALILGGLSLVPVMDVTGDSGLAYIAGGVLIAVTYVLLWQYLPSE